MHARAGLVPSDFKKNCRNGMLRDQYLRQGAFHESNMLFHTAPDSARHSVVKHGIGCEYVPIGFPVAIVHGVAITNKQLFDLKPIRNLLQ